jgi:hypothetical protein
VRDKSAPTGDEFVQGCVSEFHPEDEFVQGCVSEFHPEDDGVQSCISEFHLFEKIVGLFLADLHPLSIGKDLLFLPGMHLFDQFAL